MTSRAATIGLAEHMDSREEPVLALAKRLGVTWRTIRDARKGKLRSLTKASEIRAAISKLDGVRIDLASMLAPDIIRVAKEIASSKAANG